MIKKVLVPVLCALLFACSSAPIQGVKVDLQQLNDVRGESAAMQVSVSGQPSAADFRSLADRGYTTILDLRGLKEDRGLDEAAVVEELGMTYVSLPVTGRDGVSFENAARLDELISSVEGPILAHCGSGNRVAALLALRASAAGASDEEAVAIGEAAGLTSLLPLVREKLAAEK